MKAKKAVLEMKNICKSFNGNPVLKNVDYTVYESEIVALMGGNGAGKSTLMKILNGVYQADQGEIRVGGGENSQHPGNSGCQGSGNRYDFSGVQLDINTDCGGKYISHP